MEVALTPAREKELRIRVMRGVEALDATTPNWWKDIDLARLDLTDCVDCVLGQLYCEYTTGVAALTELLDELHLVDEEHFDNADGCIIASHYGFDHDDALQYDWVEEDDEAMLSGLLDTSKHPTIDHQLDLVGRWWSEIIRSRQQTQE